MPKFQLQSDFQLMGDQSEAIAQLFDGLNKDDQCQTVFGATGTGKTFTIANIIQATQRPTLIMAHNKTLGMFTFHPQGM